jgi:OOP family OmpA-OmpF porin
MRKILSVAGLFFYLMVWGGTPYLIENNQLVLPQPVVFIPHANDVKDLSDPMLDYVAEYLKEKAYISTMRIESHVFTEKTPAENLSLSLQRAALISYYLTQKGVDCQRLLPVGFGDTKPIDTANVQINTRLEFHNAALNGHAISGMPLDGSALKTFDPCE